MNVNPEALSAISNDQRHRKVAECRILYRSISILLIAAVLVAAAPFVHAASAGVNVQTDAPPAGGCAVRRNSTFTIDRWTVFKNGAALKQGTGPWGPAKSFTCKTMGIKDTLLARGHYVVFYIGSVTHTMCIHGKPEVCPVPLFTEDAPGHLTEQGWRGAPIVMPQDAKEQLTDAMHPPKENPTELVTKQ